MLPVACTAAATVFPIDLVISFRPSDDGSLNSAFYTGLATASYAEEARLDALLAKLGKAVAANPTPGIIVAAPLAMVLNTDGVSFPTAAFGGTTPG